MMIMVNVRGALTWDQNTGETQSFEADAVIFSGEGTGELMGTASTNLEFLYSSFLGTFMA